MKPQTGIFRYETVRLSLRHFLANYVHTTYCAGGKTYILDFQMYLFDFFKYPKSPLHSEALSRQLHTIYFARG